MAKQGPCFKDLWDLACLGQVCATGREGCPSIHWPLSWGSCPVPATTTGRLTAESQESGPKEQLGSCMWSTPFAPPDTKPMEMQCICVQWSVFYSSQERGEATSWNTILGSRLKITMQFHKGFLILQWGKSFLVVKSSASWEVDPGSRK